MRSPAVLLALSLAGVASADRIFIVPTGSKILLNTIRAEYRYEPSRPTNYSAYLGMGLTKEIELELITDRFGPDAALGSFNFSYTFLNPIVDTSPGISFGVQDGLDRTEFGRMYYLALSYRMSQDGRYTEHAPVELTLGGGFGRRSGIFVGLQVPFTWHFRGFVEHDTRRLTTGFEYRVFKGFAVRTMFRYGQTNWAFRYTYRF